MGVRETDQTFSANWNRSAFQFEHTLVDHPLFEPEALADLAGRLPQNEEFVYWRNTKSGRDGTWFEPNSQVLSLQDTIKNMATSDSLVILTHVEVDPVFGPILQDYLASIVATLEPHQVDDIMMGDAVIYINSPNRITHYHIDGRCGFPASVRGEKTFYVYDPSDRQVLPVEEVENYFNGDLNAAKFKQDFAARGKEFHLRPGAATHIPVNAPHWVQTGPGVAISVTFNFTLRSTQKLRRISKLNHHLRQRGLRPAAIGQIPVLDAGLDTGLKTLHLARRQLNKKFHEVNNYPVWTPRGIKPRMVFA